VSESQQMPVICPLCGRPVLPPVLPGAVSVARQRHSYGMVEVLLHSRCLPGRETRLEAIMDAAARAAGEALAAQAAAGVETQ